jgi:hypothetical protein
MKSPHLRMRWDPQVVNKNSFTPLKDAQGDQPEWCLSVCVEHLLGVVEGFAVDRQLLTS